MDHAYSNVSITILKKGHPNGLFSFTGTIRPGPVISEPQSGATQISIPVQRSFGSSGSVTVSDIFGLLFLFTSLKIVIFIFDLIIYVISPLY